MHVAFKMTRDLEEVREFDGEDASLNLGKEIEAEREASERERQVDRCSSCECIRTWLGLQAKKPLPIANIQLEDFGTAHIVNGPLWKLNSDAHSRCDLHCWRRRMFYLQRKEDQLFLCYKSEKTDGKMSLSCTVHTKDGKGATLTKLDIIPVEELVGESHDKVLMDLFAYDAAIGIKEEGPAAYKGDIPKELHPIEVVGFDATGAKHTIIVAADKEKTCRTWMNLTKEAVDRYQRRVRANKPGRR